MSLNNGYIVDYEVLKNVATLQPLQEIIDEESDTCKVRIGSIGYTAYHKIFQAIGITEGDLEEGHWYVVFNDTELYETQMSPLGLALQEADAFPDDLTWEDDRT